MQSQQQVQFIAGTYAGLGATISVNVVATLDKIGYMLTV